jgi:hypothetical protein
MSVQGSTDLFISNERAVQCIDFSSKRLAAEEHVRCERILDHTPEMRAFISTSYTQVLRVRVGTCFSWHHAASATTGCYFRARGPRATSTV